MWVSSRRLVHFMSHGLVMKAVMKSPRRLCKYIDDIKLKLPVLYTFQSKVSCMPNVVVIGGVQEYNERVYQELAGRVVTFLSAKLTVRGR